MISFPLIDSFGFLLGFLLPLPEALRRGSSSIVFLFPQNRMDFLVFFDFINSFDDDQTPFYSISVGLLIKAGRLYKSCSNSFLNLSSELERLGAFIDSDIYSPPCFYGPWPLDLPLLEASVGAYFYPAALFPI